MKRTWKRSTTCSSSNVHFRCHRRLHNRKQKGLFFHSFCDSVYNVLPLKTMTLFYGSTSPLKYDFYQIFSYFFLTPIFDIFLALRLQNPHASLQRSHVTDDQTVCSVIFLETCQFSDTLECCMFQNPKKSRSVMTTGTKITVFSLFLWWLKTVSLSHKKHSHKIRGRGKSQGGAGLQLRLCCEWRTAPVTAGLCSSQAWRGTFPCGAASPPRTSVLLQTQREAGSLITLISSHHKNPLARFLPSCCLTSPWWM